MSWSDAQESCPDGFRPPTRQEMADLLGSCDAKVRDGDSGGCNACPNSAGCSALFPDDAGWYWTASKLGFISNHAWLVRFDIGYLDTKVKYNMMLVRCLRDRP